MTATAAIEQTLKARLAELAGRARMIEDDLRQPLDDDLPEQAIDLADDEALVGVDDVIHQEIAQIHAALHRIENGTYGTCTACGEPISAERLVAQPTATRCIACAKAS